MIQRGPNKYTLLPGGLALIHMARTVNTVIDARDLPLVLRYHWHAVGGARVATTVAGRCLYMARVILGCRVDHINRDPLDNRRKNLRPASQSQNMMNRAGWSRKSRYKGVAPNGRGWRGQIVKERRLYYSPTYKTQEEAALWYNEQARALHGPFAVVNDVVQ